MTKINLQRQTKGPLPWSRVSGAPILSATGFEDVEITGAYTEYPSFAAPSGWPTNSGTKVASFLYPDGRRTTVLYYYGRKSDSADPSWWRMDRACVANESFAGACYAS